ncbi:alpha/beta fold hydrolase [Actinoplanes couchii]|uniref:Alpha/beta hydrolase n=1 Tax=Actinoplanes couchii TaxID=403638 RepID=A0ABQ3XMI7_9ACTN|nr:alpha/beta fold hydrolase [Actinoplanes couchii]MDR6321613.1 pimeloyl-ACP methyl ester carboxylesterase [Actinoplanes couchii]GID59708.1 alpha/beta hydrolase [Actinoplanes couchii]
MTEKMIKVGNDTLWADDSGDGPPLVLVHPGVGDSRVWDPILPELLRKYRVIRYDARGFGRSPAPTERFVRLDDLIAVLDHFGVDRAPVVGCSMGGDAALGLTITRPERVSALVLLCPGISGFPVPETDPAVRDAYAAAEKEGFDAIVEVSLSVWARAGRTPEVVDLLRSGVRGWMAEEDWELPNPEVFDRLGEIAVPTSLLVGDLDVAWIVDAARQAATRIPGVEFVEVPGVDHLPSVRVPERVLELIEATVKRSAG